MTSHMNPSHATAVTVPAPLMLVNQLNPAEDPTDHQHGTTVAARKPRFHLYTPGEIESFPEPSWLIKDVVKHGSFALLYGPSNVGKSFVALDMALSIATGRPWQGRSVKQGPVVYVVGEGQAGIKDRLAAWKDAHGPIHDFYVVTCPVQLVNVDELKEFLNSIQTAGVSPLLCVFDTLARCAAGLDENSSTAMGQLVEAATRMVTGRDMNVLLIHHAGRKGSTPRGHSVLDGATDTMMFCDKKGGAGSFALKCTKQKDAEFFEDIFLELEKASAGSCIVVPSQSAVAKPSRSQTALDALQRLGGRATHRDWQTEWQRGSGQNPSNFSKAKKELLTSGAVVADGKDFVLSIH